MAEAPKKFPRLPISAWWKLRKQFKQSIPGVVTDSYLATVLGIKPDSARANILPFLKQLGIIDEEGKSGDRARLWRDDERYPAVCKEILKEVYPDELLHAAPGPSIDRGKAERWFAHQTGTGAAAAGMMTSLYAVLMEADATKQPDQEKKERSVRTSEDKLKHSVTVTPRVRHEQAPTRKVERDGDGDSRTNRQVPGININLQVHISADATADQIDQIFASMAKHIYPRD